ncbi:MAG TPA: hypothetical protein VFM29_00360 [Vicinamibacteria bacterium]|nr:hypothetical protein [Vicinamibacteria bacterium]
MGARNVRGGLMLLSLGLLLGLLMSLYAFVPMVRVPAALDTYDDLPRRLVRLAHIAAVMLPLINIVVGGCLDGLPLSRRVRDLASRGLLYGAAGLPATLLLEAAWAPARAAHLSGLPALTFCVAVFAVTWGAWRLPRGLVAAGSK